MKNWFHRLILILFFIGVTPAFAGLTDGPTVDRKAIFEKAYQVLAVVMDQSRDMAMFNNDLNGQEMETFRKIAAVVYADFHSRKKDRLVFSDDQELFKLDPSQPIRTAVTSSDPVDPIYINLKVINAANSQFQLEDAIQILVHEYGHKTTDKVQVIVDSVATKLRTFIMGSITRSTTDRGETLTTMGFQTLFGGAEVNKLISGRSEQEKMMLLETMLYQNAKGVFDVSLAWSGFLASHPGYISKQKNIFVNTGINILKITFDRSQGEQIIFHIDYQQDSVATPNGRMGAGDNHIEFMRQGSMDLSTEVILNREQGAIQSVFLRRYLLAQPQLRAKIESIVQVDKETFRLVAAIRTPFDFKNIKLVIESGFEQYSITAKEFSPGKDRVVFEFKVPQVAVETPIMIRSFTTEERALIFFDEGVGIKVKPMSLPPGDLAFKNAYFTDGTIVSDYVNPQPIESSKALLVVMVKSPVDLLEVRLGIRTDLAVLNPDAQFSSANKPASISMDKIDSIRSGYEVKHFDSSQFKQVRKGEYIEVSMPVKMYMSDVKSPFPSKEKDLFAAINQGSNAIVNVEIIDRSLRSLRLGGPGKFMPYVLKTQWSAPTFYRASSFVAPSCSGLFGAH
jgi:hypothetical protein